MGLTRFFVGVIFEYDEQHTKSVEMKVIYLGLEFSWQTPLSMSFKVVRYFSSKERES